MTNLEFYKDLILKKAEKSSSLICSICQIKNKKCEFCIDGCPSNKELFNWLCEEQKEPIKLKQWEYDLIETNDQPHNRCFNSFMTYRNMKDKGYFKGVCDTNMTLAEILENCEVEDVNS